MTFKKLLQSNTWSEIESIFLDLYPDAKNDLVGYEMVFKKLGIIEPEHIDMSILIAINEKDDEAYVDVSGLYNHPENEAQTFPHAIEFVPWCQWLGMDISAESLSNFTAVEIIVHCLREMTYLGFSEEAIQKINDRMKKRSDKMKSISEEEQDAINASVEDLLDNWRKADEEE